MAREYSTKSLKKGQKASLVAIIIAVALAIIKGITGFLSGSTSLVSDALNSGSDSIVMVASWIGLRISRKKPTEKFPYGFYKVESLVTLGIAVFILVAAGTLIYEGIKSLIYLTIPIIMYPIISSAIAIISAIAAALTAIYLIRVGRNINSQLLIASGRERIGDIVTSLSVLVSIILSFFYSLPLIEGIVTIIISILILRMGIYSLKDAVFALMDISPSKEIEEEIKKLVKDMEIIENFENLKLRKSGPFIFGEIEIDIKKSINVEKAHRISEELKEKIYDEIKEIQSFTVHIEPAKLFKYKIVIPIIENDGLDSIISKHFGRAKEYLILEIENEKIINYHSIENPFVDKEKRAGLSAIKMLLKKEPIDVLITYEMGEISYHTLSDHLIEIYNCSEKLTADEIFQRYKEKKLTHLKRPTKEKEII